MVLFPLAVVALVNVSFSAPATPASRLLPAIGKTIGVKMEAGPRVAREVLLVSVKDVSPAELMKRIAQATGGEWERVEDAYRLDLSSGADARERRAEAIQRGASWLSQARSDPAQARLNPGQAAIGRLLAKLSPEKLGGMGPRERWVFSSRPTAMQLPIAPSLLTGLDFRRLPLRNYRTVVDGVPQPPPPSPPPVAVVQLVLQASTSGDALDATLVTASADGKIIGQEGRQYWTGGGFGGPPSPPVMLPLPDGLVACSAKEKKRAVALSALNGVRNPAAEMMMGDDMAVRTPMYSQADLSGRTASLDFPELLEPETIEPLALAAGPVLARLAEGQKENLVADIPDSAFEGGARIAAEDGLRASVLVLRMRYELGIDLTNEAGWMIAKPRQPASARASRLDRVSLGTTLRSLARDHVLSLDDLANYAEAQPIVVPSQTFEGLAFGAVDVVYGKRMSASVLTGERLLFRLYRSLKSGQTSFRQSYASLPSKGRALLSAMVFNNRSGPRPVMGAGNGMRERFGSNYGLPWQSYEALTEERTVFWPNGVPANATLSVETGSEPIWFGLAPNGSRIASKPSGTSIMISSNGRGPSVVSTNLPRLSRYRMGAVRRWTISLSGELGYGVSWTLTADSIDPNSAVVAYEALPQALRTTIENSEESAQRSASNGLSQGTSGKP